MKLNYEQIKSIAWGADRVELIDGYFCFFRFTKAQELLYFERNAGSYDKTISSSGVKLVFRTNSEKLAIDAFVGNNSTRKYFSFDVFSNGKLVGCIDNFSNTELPQYLSTLGPTPQPLLNADTPVVCLVTVIILKIPLFSLLERKSSSHKRDLQNNIKCHPQLKGPRRALESFMATYSTHLLHEKILIGLPSPEKA